MPRHLTLMMLSSSWDKTNRVNLNSNQGRLLSISIIIISVNTARCKVLCTVGDSFNCYGLGGYGNFTPYQ